MVEFINPFCFHQVDHLIVESLIRVIEAIVSCALMELIGLIIIIDCGHISLWKLEHLSYLSCDLVGQIGAFEQSHSLGFVEDGLYSVVVALKLGLLEPLANILLAWGIIVQEFENLS